MPEKTEHAAELFMRAGARDNPSDAAAETARLVVAADYPSPEEALRLAANLAGLPLWLKVGLELFTASGPELLKKLAGHGFPVFLDLKFHDIPNTVHGAARSATRLGVRMLTLHVSGGEKMCRAALNGRQEALDTGAKKPGPLLMGVTVLTSESGDFAAISRLVLERAKQARQFGLDGVVCSGHEAAAVKEACGDDFLCLCPGIRFPAEGAPDAASRVQDQARVCTPDEAVKAGADFLVMGRPLTRAADPALATKMVLARLRSFSR